MDYPEFNQMDTLLNDLHNYARLKCEQGASSDVQNILSETERGLTDALKKISGLADGQELKLQEPDDLPSILQLREDGPRKLWNRLPEQAVLQDKMNGALLGRMIGCILGSPVELMDTQEMKAWCDYNGKDFPPTDFWETVEKPYRKNFYGAYRYEYIKHHMRSVPVDDDIIYTQLVLLILEEFGTEFTTEQVGEAWVKYLPFACTAEEVALNNLKKGIPAAKAGEIDNPYCQLIGAAIRSDGFAYAAPGLPEKAARMAYYDAYLSHRRNGIYGEMFLAASQSAAFAVKDPLEAIRIALTEIPKESSLHKDIEWALAQRKTVKNSSDARKLVDERFRGMDPVHTNNNLCLIVFGLSIADGDFVKGISELVAMGMDNDCTAASAGSILGAVCGLRNIPEYLYRRFHNTCETYLSGVEKFKIDDMANRFVRLAHHSFI